MNIKIHTLAAKSYQRLDAGKMGCKSDVSTPFSKQMLLFQFFLHFILWYEKKHAQFLDCYCYYIPYMFSIFIKIDFGCYNLSVTLPSQISSRRYYDYYRFGLSMAIIINYAFFQHLRLMYICAIKAASSQV